MTPKLYLHIGMNKTGSTTIQHFMRDRRADLRQQGILYPETGLGNRNEGDGYHYFLSKALGFTNTRLEVPEGADPAGEMIEALRSEVERVKPERVIISSEFFCVKRDMTSMRRFLEGWDAKVIVYLRRHDKWYPSLYAQALKSVPNPPWEPGLAGYVKFYVGRRRGYRTYGDMLNAWSKLIGRENVIVRPFEPAAMPKGLLADFFEACGVEGVDGIDKQQDNISNRAFGSVVSDVFEQVRRCGLPEADRNRIVDSIIRGLEGCVRNSGTGRDELATRLARHCPDHAAIADEMQRLLEGGAAARVEPTGLVADFLALEAYARLGRGAPLADGNVAVGPAILGAIATIWRSDLPGETKIDAVDLISNQARRYAGKLELSPEMKTELLSEHETDYVKIARTYLGRKHGRLFSS